MNPLNPLFLDSTKPIGDKVVTNVELLNLALHDGEAVYFEVVDQFGFTQRYAMKVLETKRSRKLTAEVWLNYQHRIQYRFLLVKEGEDALASAFREAHAGHVISEKWEPCSAPPKVKIERRSERDSDSPKVVKKDVKAIARKPLCQPVLVDQIQLLLEELS